MKILMVSEDVPHPHLGGLGKHALNLAHELQRRGHQVDFLGNGDHNISNHPDQSGPGHFFGEITGQSRGWKERRIGAFTPMRTVFNGRRVAAAILARAMGYDVVHYHGHLPWIASYIPVGVPFIQTRHDQGGDCMLKTRYRPGLGRCTLTDPADCAGCASAHPNAAQRLLSGSTVRHMRRSTARAYELHPVLFVSGFLREAFARVSGCGPQGEVIHNAVDTHVIATVLQNDTNRDDTDLRAVEFFSAGAMLAYKGYGQLLAALAERPLPANMRLTLAGDGPLLTPLRQAYASPTVRFLGWMAYGEVLRYMAAADAVIVPSDCDEPCATTVLEALALGKTVYALRRGGTPELARYALPKAGALRLFDTPGEMAAAMFAQAPPAGVSRTALQQTFACTMERMAEQVLRVYAERLGVQP